MLFRAVGNRELLLMNVDWIDVVATFAVGIISIYFANSYRRQARIQLAEARRAAYAKLWEITGLAAPTRLDNAGWRGALSERERTRLYESMTDWYYRDGNGMLLDTATRRVYLEAKHNLYCADEDLRPSRILRALPGDMTAQQRRGCISIRQLSLLRSQMKTDLAIYGEPYVRRLTRHERAFLTYCGINLGRDPWRAAALAVEGGNDRVPVTAVELDGVVAGGGGDTERERGPTPVGDAAPEAGDRPKPASAASGSPPRRGRGGSGRARETTPSGSPPASATTTTG